MILALLGLILMADTTFKSTPGGKVERTSERFRQFYEPTARSVARQKGLHEGLFLKQIGAESNWIPTATSIDEARGLGQILDATFKQYAQPGESPYDGVSSLKVAGRYMADLMEMFNGTLLQKQALAMVAYNWGPGNLRKHGLAKMPKETRDYVNRAFGGNAAKILMSYPMEGVFK